jgi:two-component system sensor histidine kinase YesM
MISTIPMSEISRQSSQLKSNLVGILYSFLFLNALTSILITIHIAHPFRRLLSTVDSTGEDSLFVVSKNYKYRELNIIGNKFKELVGRIELLIKQNYVAQIAMKEVELKTLQSQINPHFLFNTMQLLQTEIVCGHIEDSNRLVLSLSNLLRYSLKRSDDTVELKEELQNVNDYLFIINLKYNNRIAIDTKIRDHTVLQCKTVKLILQPIVENAILHGFEENPQNAKLKISIVPVKKGVLIEVRDNGVGIAKDQLRLLASKLEDTEFSGENIGLYNVNQRLKLKFGPDYGIRIRSVQYSFTSVYMVLPLHR